MPCGSDVLMTKRLRDWNSDPKRAAESGAFTPDKMLTIWNNPLLVGFGQALIIVRPLDDVPADTPRCGELKLGASGLCSSSQVFKKIPVLGWKFWSRKCCEIQEIWEFLESRKAAHAASLPQTSSFLRSSPMMGNAAGSSKTGTLPGAVTAAWAASVLLSGSKDEF
ncbi:hypothetical protein DFH09DRAFT_1067024 [Mycena vulgaris]|nr:hypothetical protein DFH09DRAFT_1067024 [Mycena vulgaris]